MEGSNNQKIILITGVGQVNGIGLALVRRMASVDTPLTLLVTSRAGDEWPISTKNKGTIIEFIKLDIEDQASVDSVVQHVKQTYGHLDVLVNNAAKTFEMRGAGEAYGQEVARKSINCNYYGTLKMMESFIPIMPEAGRIINVGTSATRFMKFDNSELRRIVENKPDVKVCNQLAEDYVAAAGKPSDSDGWLHQDIGFDPAYTNSKALLNFLTGAAARAHPNLAINVCCPGLVDTGNNADGFGGFKFKTPNEAATLPMKLALDDVGNITGKFWCGSSSTAVDDGAVLENWMDNPMVMDIHAVAAQ